jgi:hypothetical protein
VTRLADDVRGEPRTDAEHDDGDQADDGPESAPRRPAERSLAGESGTHEGLLRELAWILLPAELTWILLPGKLPLILLAPVLLAPVLLAAELLVRIGLALTAALVLLPGIGLILERLILLLALVLLARVLRLALVLLSLVLRRILRPARVLLLRILARVGLPWPLR